ncbi:MAG: hypothetical protein RBU37_02460 [Myxococcota bacterium]|jgi:endonuclease/exonuclease/phosphatase family metal-dependent hydrolase|nr:hypothetical protein [Myxococcota bacterium]
MTQHSLLSLRLLLLLLLWSFVGCAARSPHEQDAMLDAEIETEALVVATLNTHSFQEGLDSLSKLDAIGVELARLGAQLVVANELMSGRFFAYDMGGAEHDAAQLILDALQRASGEDWEYALFPWAHWDTGELMSNAVFCRGKVLESDARALTTTDFWPAPLESRGVGYALLELEGLAPVEVFVTHSWGWDSADTLAQISEVKAFMVEKHSPLSRLTLLMGDLNLPSSWPAFQAWLEPPPLSLLDTFALAWPENPHQSSQNDGEHRIDHVLMRDGACQVEKAHFAFDGELLEGQLSPVVSDHKGVVVHLRCPAKT